MATVLPDDELLIQKQEGVKENYAIVPKGQRTPVSPFNQVVKIKTNIWHLNLNLPSDELSARAWLFSYSL